jgi:hypothetical protein
MGEKYKKQRKIYIFFSHNSGGKRKTFKDEENAYLLFFKKRPYIVPHQPLPQNLLSGFSQTCPP